MAEVTVAPAIPIGGGSYRLYDGKADYYCTSVNDENIINDAIQYIVGAYGGGTVRLLEGTFNTVGYIDLLSNISLVGNGSATIIKNTNATGSTIGVVFANGSVAVNRLNVQVSGIAFDQTRSTILAVYILNTKTASVRNNYFSRTQTGIVSVPSAYVVCDTCQSITVSNNDFNGNTTGDSAAIAIGTITTGIVSDNTIHDVANAQTPYGIYISSTSGVRVENNNIYKFSFTGGITSGILVDASNVVIANNRIEQVKNLSVATNVHAVYISTGTSDSVIANYCINNGSDSGIANTNGNQFSDSGTDTQVYSNSWQSPVTGEPSDGTFHPLASFISVLTTGVAITQTSFAANFTSTQLPVGVKAVYVSGYFIGSAAAFQYSVRDVVNTNDWIPGFTQVAAQRTHFSGMVPVSSTMGYKHFVTSTTMTASEKVSGYWI